MTRHYVAERRKKNREIAAIDQANRCWECKLDLAQAGVVIEDFLIDGKFCSDACLEQFKAREER